MYVDCDGHPDLPGIARRQCGVVTREQLAACGVTTAHVKNQIAARRWAPWARRTVVLHNASPTRTQLMWIAVLDPECRCALASHTALELHGFRGFAEEAQRLHIVVPRGGKCAELRGVQVHESRRFFAPDITRRGWLPSTAPARSTIDAAAWQPWPRFAVTMMAAAVQQRLCTVEQLDQALARVGQVRHKAYMRLALGDIAGGAQALGEIDFAALCRRFGLQAPDRQRLRRDARGRRRYLDCEWELDDGTIVVLEIDGSHHHHVEHWEADMKRERQVVISRRWVLRASSAEVRLDAANVVADLVAMGVPRTLGRLVSH